MEKIDFVHNSNKIHAVNLTKFFNKSLFKNVVLQGYWELYYIGNTCDDQH